MNGRASGAPPSVKQHASLASNLPEVYPANKLDCSDGEKSHCACHRLRSLIALAKP